MRAVRQTSKASRLNDQAFSSNSVLKEHPLPLSHLAQYCLLLAFDVCSRSGMDLDKPFSLKILHHVNNCLIVKFPYAVHDIYNVCRK